MNCPTCNTSNAYVGFMTVECPNPNCFHFVQPKGEGIYFGLMDSYEEVIKDFALLKWNEKSENMRDTYSWKNRTESIIQIIGIAIAKEDGFVLYKHYFGGPVAILPKEVVDIPVDNSFVKSVLSLAGANKV